MLSTKYSTAHQAFLKYLKDVSMDMYVVCRT